jgi:hypothetical protein
VTSRRKEPIEAMPPDFFLAGYTEDVRAAADRLRAVVKRAVPDVVERVRPGWRIIGYDLPIGRRSVYFAWVMPEPVHVHLGFVHGAFVDDPDRRLEGAHLRLVSTRFVTFELGDDIPEREMEELTRQAARIAVLSREERFALMLDRDAAPDPAR